MEKKFCVIALAVLAFGLVPRSEAGTEMVIDNSKQAPVYNYAPPPPVYYAPPPVSVVVYPTVRHYIAPIRVYHRFHGRPRFVGLSTWRSLSR